MNGEIKIIREIERVGKWDKESKKGSKSVKKISKKVTKQHNEVTNLKGLKHWFNLKMKRSSKLCKIKLFIYFAWEKLEWHSIWATIVSKRVLTNLLEIVLLIKFEYDNTN